MAIDNSLYNSLENTYKKIQTFIDTATLTAEHSPMIIKNEELLELLEKLDIEAIEEQSTDIHALHAQLSELKAVSTQVVADLNGSAESIPKVVAGLDRIFLEINALIV